MDDDPAILDVLRITLGTEGYDVHGVENPLTALEFYRHHWPSISMVLLDYRMPHMLGNEVFTHLRAINPDVAVVLITSHSPEDIHQMRRDGLRGVVLKPFHIDTVVQTVRETLAPPASPHSRPNSPNP